MSSRQQFCKSSFDDETHVAERELSRFFRAVTHLFSAEQAKLSVEEWLVESDLPDSPPCSSSRNWRAVTTAVVARVAMRLAVNENQRTETALMTAVPQEIEAAYAQ
jgi:hypothetical protein